MRQNPTVGVVAIKVPEFVGTQTSSSRLGNYLDAAVQLAAVQADKVVVARLYGQMATRRADVKRDAEQRVGRTETNWDEQMADAVAVTWAAAKL